MSDDPEEQLHPAEQDGVPLSQRWQCVYQDSWGNEIRKPPLGCPDRSTPDRLLAVLNRISPQSNARVEQWKPTERQRESLHKFFAPFAEYLKTDDPSEEVCERLRNSEFRHTMGRLMRRRRTLKDETR